MGIKDRTWLWFIQEVMLYQENVAFSNLIFFDNASVSSSKMHVINSEIYFHKFNQLFEPTTTPPLGEISYQNLKKKKFNIFSQLAFVGGDC